MERSNQGGSLDSTRSSVRVPPARSALTGVRPTLCVGIALVCAVLAPSTLAQPAPSAAPPSGSPQAAGAPNAAVPSGTVLKVCADPNNLPQSDQAGAGYENKLAEALARDLGRSVKYTFFPQRTGFVRQTLRSQDDVTKEFKCDVIIGVPKGYELTATTQPYMRSTYAMVVPSRAGLGKLTSPEDVLALPKATLTKLRFGIFAQSPATDWLLKNGLIGQARAYAAQSGDPGEHPANIIERDLEAGNIDVAIVWGPVAGFLASRHTGQKEGQKEDQNIWLSLPFKPDPAIRFDYEISMGVRFGEKEWRDTLDQWIASHQKDIRDILVSFRVPLLEPSPTKVSAAGDTSRPPDAR
jgi:quinoprotein dehydrogenase-associated probable ABC transporter substrate-binding protein